MERSKQIEVDAKTPESCSALKTECAHLSSTAGLEWAIATPLGLPVEPEV